MTNSWLFIPRWMGGSVANPFSGWRSYMTLCLLSSRLACHLHMSTADRVEMTEISAINYVTKQQLYAKALWLFKRNMVDSSGRAHATLQLGLWPSTWKVCWAGYKILGSHFLLLNILLHCFLLWCGIVEKSDTNLIFFP